MRKHLLLGSLLACLLFTGCATATNTDVAEVHSQSQEATSELTTDTYDKDLKEGVDINVKVQRNGGMYRVIISPDFFGVNEKEEDIKNEVKSWGGENIIIIPNFPALNNNGGYLALSSSKETAPGHTFDTCCFRDEMHTIDKITGISLEKKSPELSSLNKNWRSSKHATGGTPGIKNR